MNVEYADGSRSGATVLATDPVTDLAVLRTERKDLPVAEFREELPRPGDPVPAIGSPPGFENSVTAGILPAVVQMLTVRASSRHDRHRSSNGCAAHRRSASFGLETAPGLPRAEGSRPDRGPQGGAGIDR